MIMMGVPVVIPSNTPDMIMALSGSFRLVLADELPGFLRSIMGWIMVSSRGIRGGHPSMTTPTPFPWDSPQVVILKNFPNVFPGILAPLNSFPDLSEISADKSNYFTKSSDIVNPDSPFCRDKELRRIRVQEYLFFKSVLSRSTSLMPRFSEEERMNALSIGKSIFEGEKEVKELFNFVAVLRSHALRGNAAGAGDSRAGAFPGVPFGVRKLSAALLRHCENSFSHDFPYPECGKQFPSFGG